VELFESDPAGFGYHPVGYIAAVPEVQAEDCVAIQQRQAEIGYRSDVVLGERACTEHMRAIFADWNGEGIEAVLHERQGGWAETMKTVENLARLARSKGVRILEGVEVTGIDLHDGLDDVELTTADGEPPVVHLDHVVPLRSDRDGHIIEDGAWGIYYKLGRRGFGVQGGGVPIKLGPEFELEPYGPDNPNHTVGDGFTDYFTAGLAWAHERFRGKSAEWHTD